MRKLFADFETRSTVDIKKAGGWKYALSPTTDAICLAAAFAGEKPRVFSGPELRDPTSTAFKLLSGWALDPEILFVAHSAHFEYAIWNLILHRRYGLPAIWGPKRWDCTLSRAVMCGLPASLEKACMALNVPVKKDMDGRKALMRICKPIGYDPLDPSIPIWDESSHLYQRVYSYCGIDVEAEMAIDLVLPEMPPSERVIWELDLAINRRGFEVDVNLAHAASNLAATTARDLNAKLHQITCTTVGCEGGKKFLLTCTGIEKATRVQAIKRWLEAQGLLGVESLDKHAVDGLLANPEIETSIKDVLRIRRQVGKSSTAKYQSVIDAACADGRLRGGLQYHAAGPGRWGGRLLQPHNLPKPEIIAHPSPVEAERLQSEAIASVMEGPDGPFSFTYGATGMQVLSDLVRGAIMAAPGKELTAADFSAIEARALFWEADDQSALNIYRRGESPYVDMARYIYSNDSITKKSHPFEYEMGKRTILGAGYGMGWVKFQATCAQYGAVISEELAQRAIKAYREKYKSVVSMWYATERAAVAAIKSPGNSYAAMGGKICYAMSKDRRFLLCKLPAGRCLYYYRPSLKMVDGPRGEKEEIHYLAVDTQTRDLIDTKTYGGSLVENDTQAIARDLLCAGMLNIEAAGYPVVLTVHDEVVAERTIGEGKLEEFVKLMCAAPKWAAGLPLAAEGWVGRRYHK